MKTIVVYVKTPEAGQRISACATHMGLPQQVKSVDCLPALFIALRVAPVDVLLADVALASPSPGKFTRTLRTRYPATGVLFTGAADPATAETVRAAGALGVIKAKSGGADDLFVALAQAIVIARTRLVNTVGTVPRQRPTRPERLQLSEREAQVLAGLTEGKHNAEIGRDLFLSAETVKTHAKHLFRKLGARDRAHAVAIAFRIGLIT